MGDNTKKIHRTNIGGQALIEGLLMIGPENAAIAVRKPDGEIIIDKRPLPKKDVFTKIPVVRGVVNFFRQIVLGMKALMYSAEFVEIEEEEVKEAKEKKPSKVKAFFDRVFKGRLEKMAENIFSPEFLKDAAIYVAVIISLAFSIGLFILLPNFVATIIGFKNSVTYNLFEGLLRILIFFGYIVLASLMKDIKRVWEYHGAEHKTIHCYEQGEELTVENIRKYTTKHPRCGTSFMFLVMIVSILVFSLIPLKGVWFNALIRLALVPLVAGLSYEVLKFAGRSEWKIMKAINAPGMLFQIFTTREPDDSQIEVAIEAFNNALPQEVGADNW